MSVKLVVVHIPNRDNYSEASFRSSSLHLFFTTSITDEADDTGEAKPHEPQSDSIHVKESELEMH